MRCRLQALPYVILLIAMLFFIYAIIGMQVFSLYYNHCCFIRQYFDTYCEVIISLFLAF